jgi:hypothetical protein
MKIYLPDKHELDAALVHPLRQIIDLYGAGVLGDNSQVWVDPKDGVLPMFWALTDRSSLVFVLETHVPGWVRITDKRVRWARTYDATSSDKASPDLHLADLRTTAGKTLGVDAVNNFTFVVHHMDRTKSVGVIEDSEKRDMADGAYFSPARGVTVIDAAHFTPNFSYAWQDPNDPESWVSGTEPPEGLAAGEYFKLHRDPTPYEKSHAMVQGTELITRRLPPAQRNIVRSNIDEHGIEVLPDTLTAIEEKTRGVYLQFAQSTLMTLRQQLGSEERLFPAADDEPAQAAPPAEVMSELAAQAE